MTTVLEWEYLGEFCVVMVLIWPFMMALTTIELWEKERHGNN